MPGMSPDGNESPTSINRMRPASSRQAMLRPTSPTPPRKTTLTTPSEETGVLQRLSDPLPLLRRGRDERETRDPRRAPEHLEGRLHGNRVRRDEQGVEQGRERLVDLSRRRDVAGLDELDHLADLGPHEMARDGDHPDGAQTHVPERGPVVARVDLEVRSLGHESRD